MLFYIQNLMKLFCQIAYMLDGWKNRVTNIKINFEAFLLTDLRTKYIIKCMLRGTVNLHKKIQLYILNGSWENHTFLIALSTYGRTYKVRYSCADNNLSAFLSSLIGLYLEEFYQGGRGHWTGNYTGSFIRTLSYLLV